MIPLSDRRPPFVRLTHQVGRIVIGTMVRSVTLEGLDRPDLPRSGPLIVAAKHQSMWETFALLQFFDQPLYILKRELTWIPVFGWLLLKGDMIAINRQKGGRILMEMARREKLTLRDLYYRVAAARGHLLLVGTPAMIADTLQRWFEAGAADGFNVMPPFFPGQFDAFADSVVPILQERGLFRKDYEGSTLRDHLGIARPALR